MTRRPKQQQQTFAELVREVEVNAPEVLDTACPPGAHGESCFVDRDGEHHRLVDASIDAPTAQRAAADGAVVVWDPCACGGYCGYQWIEPEQAHRLGSTPPRIRNTKKRRARIALYRDDRGRELLLVEGSVDWGATIS